MATSIVIMTRFPESGRNKTRLIPALGKEGAMRMHDRLARHTIARCSAFCLMNTAASFTIHLAGGNEAQGREWLGLDKTRFIKQPNGDLGERMSFAMNREFSKGADKVIIVGTDCPELDEAILAKTVESLDENDVVFGPALDGGYYLIGSRKPVDTMFEKIPWGTSDVLSRSLAAAERSKLKVTQLEPLLDIDMPEDLPFAEKSLESGKS